MEGITFNLIQFHVHTGSEHTAAGVQSELELHMVHKGAGDSDYAVVGFMCNTGIASANMITFLDSLEASMSTPTSVDVDLFLNEIDTTKYPTT